MIIHTYTVMASSVFLSLIINAVLFSTIFWIIAFIFKFSYGHLYDNYKLNFYECGFKSLHNIKIQYNVNYLLFVLFLILYDAEFLILLPLSFNFNFLTIFEIFFVFFFFFWLVVTLLFDYVYNALDWQI